MTLLVAAQTCVIMSRYNVKYSELFTFSCKKNNSVPFLTVNEAMFDVYLEYKAAVDFEAAVFGKKPRLIFE